MNQRIASCLIATILAGTALRADMCSIKNIEVAKENEHRPPIYVEVWCSNQKPNGSIEGTSRKWNFYLNAGEERKFNPGYAVEFFLWGTEADAKDEANRGEKLRRSDVCDMDCTGGEFWLTRRWNFEVTTEGERPGVNTSTFWRKDRFGGGCPPE